MTRFLALGATLALCGGLMGAADPDAERANVEQWRAARVAELKADDGWLNLVGLYWLEPGANSFGRAPANRLVLNHHALAGSAGTFVLDEHGVHFIAHKGSGITCAGKPVTGIDMVPDTRDKPTILASGSLEFFVIERAGKLGVRVRDLDSQRKQSFSHIDYFPIDTGWAFDARFEPYEPHRRIRIVNILGLEEEKDSPGAIIFNKDGHEWRLDAVLESPSDQHLFVMFADATNGHETYGGGRFLHVPLPTAGPDPGSATTRVDFNESYNPPCAFNDFATCPLPPYQNHLALRVESGEKTYGEHLASPGK